jgi:hypothetical protein
MADICPVCHDPMGPSDCLFQIRKTKEWIHADCLSDYEEPNETGATPEEKE